MNAATFTKRPWLLVWLAFILVIIGWVHACYVASGVPTQRLTPQEEAALLQKGKL